MQIITFIFKDDEDNIYTHTTIGLKLVDAWKDHLKEYHKLDPDESKELLIRLALHEFDMGIISDTNKKETIEFTSNRVMVGDPEINPYDFIKQIKDNDI